MPELQVQLLVIPNYAVLSPKHQFRMPICQFSIKFSLFKADICFGKAQNAIILLQNLLESLFSRILKIPLLPDLCKTFFSVHCLSTASQVSPGNDDAVGKLTPHEHANIWRGRRSALPPSPTL